jgi:N-methylhydantoinase A
MATRFGVDVGGTFTDLVLYEEETGRVLVGKGPTTPQAPEQGIGAVVSEVIAPAVLREARFFMHGTTVGINALLERKGAVVGLLTTEGFRDTLELRRGDRDAMYDNLWKAPPPLVPRRLRVPVRERVLADGTVETPIECDGIRAAVELFARESVESVAIVFINAYANPAHELAAAAALREHGFEGDISISHQVSGEFREYERTSTTVIDAYVRPRISHYLRRLDEALRAQGFGGECLITRSGGGAMSFPEAEARPFETVMSGPVAGAVGSGELCRELGIPTAITADVGGTTFDTCLIVDGRPQVKYEGMVVGMPLQSPWVDVRSIGAGGGSIAFVDGGGLLRVGPRSAGAEPGPICYRRGGTEPTTTDAAALLGMLAFGELAGGLRLDIDGARPAVERLGVQVGLGVDETARGIVAIANAAMADAIRTVTIEQGLDVREATILAYGGAGPLFGTLLARELGVRTVVVPNHAGNFSAWGLLQQDLTRSAAMTSISALTGDGLRAANEVLAGLYARLRERQAGGPAAAAEEIAEPAMDLRYTGQEHTLTIHPPAEAGEIVASPEAIAERFAAEYERSFSHVLDEAIEIVSVRAVLRTPLPAMRQGNAEAAPPPAERSVDAFSFSLGRRTQFAVVGRAAISSETPTAGPVIVLEDTTTTYVDAGFEVRAHPGGALLIHDAEDQGR